MRFFAQSRELGESTGAVLTAGGLAGIFSWVFTYPQDVIKSRLQADGWGRGQQYRGSLHCLQASLASEGRSFLVRGIGSTIIRAFPMNAVTFWVYKQIMNTYGQEDSHEDLDTLETVSQRRGLGGQDLERMRQYQRVSTLATDGPSIICVQEPLVSPVSQTRLYPEQMLWACPPSSALHHEERMARAQARVEEEESFSNYCNFNQFTQMSPLDDLYNEPSVLAPEAECGHDLVCPSLLCDPRQNEQRRHQITTRDFLLPTNLLANMKTSDRIYGFYYIVA